MRGLDGNPGVKVHVLIIENDVLFGKKKLSVPIRSRT